MSNLYHYIKKKDTGLNDEVFILSAYVADQIGIIPSTVQLPEPRDFKKASCEQFFNNLGDRCKVIFSNADNYSQATINPKLKSKSMQSITQFCVVDDKFYFTLVVIRHLNKQLENKDSCYISGRKFYFDIKNHQSAKDFVKTFDTIEFFKRKKAPENEKISFIVKAENGLDFHNEWIKKKKNRERKIDFNCFYNEDLNHQKLTSIFKGEDGGLIAFDGEPGTGKSTLIRHLGKQTKREVVFLPSYMLAALEDVNFLKFTLLNLRDKILVIEDCERILLDRGKNTSPSISTILNLTSGTIGEITNVLVVVTYNTKEKIDEALLRKGRLLYSYKFKELSVDRANKLSDHLGYEEIFNTPTTLSDVINVKVDNNHIKHEKNSIGFGMKKVS